MTHAESDQLDPELHLVVGDAPGSTYETPLTLGPDSDHTDDPIRNELNAVAPTQPAGTATDHATGEDQARDNAENEPPA